MNGCCSIDFVPKDGAVARMLVSVEEAGLTVRGIRLIPCVSAARATLRLELDADHSDRELMALAEMLLTFETTIDVIHRANDCRVTALVE